jgi:adhesin transport system membrane fusion protein
MAKEDHLMGNSEDDKKTTDLDFMSDINAATRLQPSWQANILLYVICALFIFIIIWANIAKLEVITRGEGKVVPTSEIQLVQSLEGGILAELNINEGDKVTKGQILARIENVAFASEERGIEAQSLALKLKQARLNAEINENNFAIPDE